MDQNSQKSSTHQCEWCDEVFCYDIDDEYENDTCDTIDGQYTVICRVCINCPHCSCANEIASWGY